MKKELETLIQRVRIYTDNIGMKIGIVKCAMIIIKSGKQKKDRRNGVTKLWKNQKDLRKRNLQILGNIGRGHDLTCGDERKNLKEIPQESTILIQKDFQKEAVPYRTISCLPTISKILIW